MYFNHEMFVLLINNRNIVCIILHSERRFKTFTYFGGP